jgi:hypothetical protein
MRIPVVTVALAAFAAVAAGPIPALAANNDVPQFDVKPSCTSATKAANDLNKAGDNLRPGDRSADNCIHDETDAKAKLDGQWTQYPVLERQRCSRLSTLGGLPSYVELLTCLEMAKEAANIPSDQPATKTRPGK